jgi:FkbM family methyltransferase
MVKTAVLSTVMTAPSGMLQSLALLLYRNPLTQAVMRSRLGERIFEMAYFRYKGGYEAREARYLHEFVGAGGWIVDIGANIGFFTTLFAGWVAGGKVLALEPETNNFRRLERVIAARGLGDRVEARQIAASDTKGTGYLIINPDSHADHRLGDHGLPTALETVDSLWDGLGRPSVSLIKIDVQGGERAVLKGARMVVETCKPALYVEIDTMNGGAGDIHARELLELLDLLGYQPHNWQGGWIPKTAEQILAEAKRRPGGYGDYLFLVN